MHYVVVVSYVLVMLLAAALAYRLRLNRENPRDRGQMIFFGAIACLMLLLAVNRHLGLDWLLVHEVRLMARQEGWYAVRRTVQKGAIISVLAFGVVALFGCARRSSKIAFRAVLSGLVFLLSYIFIRSVSHNSIDNLLGIYEGAIWLNWSLEMGAIVATAAGLMWYFVSIRK